MTNNKARAIAYTLKVRYCPSMTGDSPVMIWPNWLSYNVLTQLEKLGFSRHEHGGPGTYSHTEWYIKDSDKWPNS